MIKSDFADALKLNQKLSDEVNSVTEFNELLLKKYEKVRQKLTIIRVFFVKNKDTKNIYFINKNIISINNF